MRLPLLSLCSLLASAPAFAQVVPSATTGSVSVFAGGSTAAPLAPGTNVWPGFARSTSGVVGNASLSVLHAVDTSSVQTDWQLSCQAIANGPAGASAEVLYVLGSPLPQLGRLIIDWLPSSTGTGQHGMFVDVFNDGTVDAYGTAVLPVVFGPGSLVLRVQSEVNAQAGTINGPWGSSWSWSGSAQAQLSVRFEATHASVTSAMPATCPSAATLTVRPNFAQGVDILATGSAADDVAIFVLGFAGQSLPLPWSVGCTQLVDPVAPLWLPFGIGDTALLALPVPLAVRPISFLAQLVAVDVNATALSATGSLLVDLP